MTHRTPKVDIVCEVLKLLRTNALSRTQIEQELGYPRVTVARYATVLEANGLLCSWRPDPSGLGGRQPRLYAVAPAWGGQAAAGGAR